MHTETKVAPDVHVGTFLGVPCVLEYGNGWAPEYAAALNSAALMDRSAWGRIDLGGKDRLEFLHRMTTNDVRTLRAGAGVQTVLTTPEAKIVELLKVYARSESLLCITSPQNTAKVLGWFKSNIFFRDKVKPADITPATFQYTLFGPRSVDVLASMGAPDLGALPDFHSRSVHLAGFPVLVARLPGPAGGSFDLVGDAAAAREQWEALLAAGREHGMLPLGTKAYDILRIEAGQPLYGPELSEDVNPLEAGLRHAVSFAKGCYTGQEIIARLDTYQKLKQTLVRLTLSELPADALPLPLLADGAEIGRLTSAGRLPTGEVRGLGYVRMKAFQPGGRVSVASREHAIDATQMPLPQTTEVT